MEIIYKAWAWYIVGPSIALVMLAMIYLGKSFGMSTNLKTLCAIGGAGKINDFFDFDWRKNIWNLLFAFGAILGGFVATNYLSTPDYQMDLSSDIVSKLESYGLSAIGASLVPSDLFNWESLFTLRGFVLLVIGGFLVGFGTRYANGCTSGHAISGLSNLQLPSLVAVVGFFIGGLVMTHFILPFLLAL